MMNDESDMLDASKKSAAQLQTLDREIDDLKQRLRLLKSEEKADRESKEEIKKQNQERIQDLQAEIDKMQILLQKGKLADEKVLKKAFQKHPGEMGIIKGKTASEVVDILEGRVFDMTKKRDALRYEMRKKESILAQMKEDLKEIDKRCERKDDEADEDIINRAREVENEYQEAKMRILEMQQIERIYQEIQQKLTSDLLTMPTRLDDLENKYKKQQAEIQQLVERENKARESREKAKTKFLETESAAQHARQEKDKVMAEFSLVYEQKHLQLAESEQEDRRVSTIIAAEEELNHMKKSQEKQLEYYENAFEQIKIATGVTDIQDAEKRFAAQKALKDNLLDLKTRSEKMLHDLKAEKKRLETEKQTMLGAGLACPEKEMEEELEKWKTIHEEQKQRKENAEFECKRISNTIAQVKLSLWHILQLMEHHLYGTEMTPPESMPDIELAELAHQVKETLEKLKEKLEGHDVETLLQQLREEQPFLKKLEEEEISEMALRKRIKPPPPMEEESTSEDEEETRKRAETKKEAKSFADIKQKQKGRGRGLKL